MTTNLFRLLLILVLCSGNQLLRQPRGPDQQRPTREAVREPPSSSRLMALGNRYLFADLNYLGLIQEVGAGHTGESLKRFRYRGTGLDPRYFNFYYVSILAHAMTVGEASDAIEAGLDSLPHINDRWEVLGVLAWIYYFDLGKAKIAAHYWLRASQVKGAPAYLLGLSARARAQGASLAAGIALLEEALPTLTGPVKHHARVRLYRLRLEQELVRVDALCEEFLNSIGRLPASIEELGVELQILEDVDAFRIRVGPNVSFEWFQETCLTRFGGNLPRDIESRSLLLGRLGPK